MVIFQIHSHFKITDEISTIFMHSRFKFHSRKIKVMNILVITVVVGLNM